MPSSEISGVDEDRFRRWLNLTPQQFDIVTAIYRLRNRGLRPTPKAIQGEYLSSQGKSIIKPNLFNLLRELQSRKVLVRPAPAEYAIDQDGVRAALESSKRRLSEDMQELERTHSQTEQLFKDITYKREHPDVNIIEGQKMWATLAKMLDCSEEFNIAEDFPTIAYTPEIAAANGREPYWEALRRAQSGRRIRLNITTPLNTDTLFLHAFRAYEDPRTAYRETNALLGRLQTVAETAKNIDIRFTEAPLGLDLAASKSKEPSEFAVLTRDEHNQISGAIHIRSHKSAASAQRTLSEAHQAATPLKSPQGAAKMSRVRHQMRGRFGSIGR
jgi:hypothetical protein